LLLIFTKTLLILYYFYIAEKVRKIIEIIANSINFLSWFHNLQLSNWKKYLFLLKKISVKKTFRSHQEKRDPNLIQQLIITSKFQKINIMLKMLKSVETLYIIKKK